MVHVPSESSDETRLSDEPPGMDLSTVESDRAPGSGRDRDQDGEVDASGSIDGIDLTGPPRIGQLIFGRYLVEAQIGEGGMGTVWLVRHIELDAQRALKLIVSGISFDPQIRARFRREARAMARLSHPNAVTVHDARIGRESAFIEMEYVRGHSLNKILKPGVPMPLDWVARIVEQLGDVLQQAHDQKIVHRDLKPSNLMLVGERPRGKELLKVLDFGIAKLLDRDHEAEPEVTEVHTGTGCFLGSVPWSSPEQAGGGEVDFRSDLYSLGVLMYEMLTGSRPFQGPLARQIYDHLHTPPPPFARVNPALQVPSVVEALVLRCLAKKPEHRPQTARDLAAEFLWAASDEKGTASRPIVDPGPVRDSGQTLLDPALATPGTSGGIPGPLIESTEKAANPTRTARATIDPAHEPSTATMTAEKTIDDRDFEERFDTVVAPKPAVRPERILFAFGLLVIAVLALCALVPLIARRPAPIEKLLLKPPPPLPAGYAAESLDPEDHAPVVLVRNRDKKRFIRIRGALFMMGNHDFDPTGKPDDEDRPAHRVNLSDYYLQETEVTNAEMDAYFREHNIDRASRPARFQQAWDLIEKAGLDPAEFPAVGISHALAEAYAEWVDGDIPTEAQWEFAARSMGMPNRFVWEGDVRPSHKLANIASRGDHRTLLTSPVHSFRKDRTAQGVYDMTGNVREWCRDFWGPYSAAQDAVVNPEGAATASPGITPYVIRGGSYDSFADLFRTTRPRRITRSDQPTADQLAEDQSADDVGFRVVIEWPRKN